MGIRYRAALRTQRMQDVADDIDSGSGAGFLEICTVGYALVLATIPLADPCGSVSGDALTFDVPQSDTAADASGNAAIARIKNSDGVVIVDQMTVGNTGGSEHIILNQGNTAIVAGQAVTVTAFVITHNIGA